MFFVLSFYLYNIKNLLYKNPKAKALGYIVKYLLLFYTTKHTIDIYVFIERITMVIFLFGV